MSLGYVSVAAIFFSSSSLVDDDLVEQADNNSRMIIVMMKFFMYENYVDDELKTKEGYVCYFFFPPLILRQGQVS